MNKINQVKQLVSEINHLHCDFSKDYFETGRVEKINLSRTLKSQEINLDYILELIFEHNKKNKSKGELIKEVRRLIRASLGNRAKEILIVDFINQTNLDEMADKASIIDTFFEFAQAEQAREADELIRSEGLNEQAAKRYISASLKREFASENGTQLK